MSVLKFSSRCPRTLMEINGLLDVMSWSSTTVHRRFGNLLPPSSRPKNKPSKIRNRQQNSAEIRGIIFQRIVPFIVTLITWNRHNSPFIWGLFKDSVTGIGSSDVYLQGLIIIKLRRGHSVFAIQCSLVPNFAYRFRSKLQPRDVQNLSTTFHV
jgi:hypothetical protein